MRFNKALFTGLLMTVSLNAQKPVGVATVGIDGGNAGTQIDYFTVVNGTPQGDTPYFTAWGTQSLFSIPGNGFPNQTGLPIVGTWNDGSALSCSGNLGLVQLSKLPALGVPATSGNTLITPWANCMSTYSAGGVSTAPNATWNDGLTWKGAILAFRNNVLLLPFYRQNNQGTAFGASTMVASYDAGATFVDYGRWQGYTVTAAACTAGTATLTLSSLTSAGGETLVTGNKVYVHDVGSGYDGQFSITVVSSTIRYSTTCPGTTPASGFVALRDSLGSAPLGPLSGGFNMMWPVTDGKNPMNVVKIIVYGQDGNYPAGIESGCDPTAFVCFTAFDNTQTSRPMIFGRFPVGRHFDKSSYQWYSCPAYSAYWPVEDSVCNANLSGSWTGTLANATVVLFAANSGIWPGEREAMTYLPGHGSYLMPGLVRDVNGTRISWHWSPHPWGPYYPLGHSSCVEDNSGAHPLCGPGFNVNLAYQMQTVSTNPPEVKLRYTSDSFKWSSGGNPVFGQIDAHSGRVPVTGMARRANYMNTGQLGVGHRFVSGNMAGAISLSGKTSSGGTYKLDWWVDLWDHGGVIANWTRPSFRDLISGGSRNFLVSWDDGITGHIWNSHGATLAAVGPYLGGAGYNTRLTGNWNDSVLSAGSGNNDWTYVGLFDVTNPNCSISGCPAGGGVQNEFSRDIPVGLVSNAATSPVKIVAGYGSGHSGNLCVVGIAVYCTADGVINLNTWYYVAVSAKANPAGQPSIAIFLATAGTITEYGGTFSGSAANNTTVNGLTKTCSPCNTAPAISAGTINLGRDYEGIQGYLGEAALYAGVVPGHVIREIYRTLRTDWLRVGRGTL